MPRRRAVSPGLNTQEKNMHEDLEPYPEKIVQIMPAPGWEVTYHLDRPNRWTEPLVGWGLRADGIIKPLRTDGAGWVIDEEVDAITTAIHPAGERLPSIARIVALVPNRSGWDFQVRCPHCVEVHTHGAGDEEALRVTYPDLGKRAPHCKATRNYVLADPDNVIGKTLARPTPQEAAAVVKGRSC